MAKTKLCYGIKIDAGEWGKALGVSIGEKQALICDFCDKDNPKDNNFCGNCGSDLRTVITNVNPTDLVELTLRRLGGPPKPIELLPGSDCIYLCQILASSDGQDAAFTKSIAGYPWATIDRAIRAYAEGPEIEEVRPFIFALNQKEEK